MASHSPFYKLFWMMLYNNCNAIPRTFGGEISNPLHFPDYVESFDPSLSQSADGGDDGFT